MNADPIAVAHSGHSGHRGWLGFAAHYVEMLVLMFAGMGLLGAVLGMPHSSPVEIQALYMTATMTLPMVGWMLIRGHSRRGAFEMAAAMGAPLALLLPMLWAGAVSADALLDLMHVGMLPTMLAAMLYRRADYGL
jgi:flagellar biosynthetic protein FliP